MIEKGGNVEFQRVELEKGVSLLRNVKGLDKEYKEKNKKQALGTGTGT